MIQIQLSPKEKEILIHLLETEIGNLRREIAYTDSHEFKESLKEKKETYKKLLQTLVESLT